eukprot:4705940-Pleurochrysis_carterae.AAC.1
MNSQSRGGCTGLSIAAEEGHESVLAALLTANAAIDAVDNIGMTSCMLACKNGHEACVRILLEAKAAPDAAREDGVT